MKLPAEYPLLPLDTFRKAVEEAGGSLDDGPAGDLWVSSALSGDEYGPFYPYRGCITPGQVEAAASECGLDMDAIYAAAKRISKQSTGTDAPV